jgi:hypothetical protein
VFHPFPSKCEHCKSELFLDGKCEIIATQGIANLLWIQCPCGQVYFCGDGVLMRVHENGLLIPYVKRSRWLGWRKDTRVPNDVMCQHFSEENQLKIREKLHSIGCSDSYDY